MQYKLYRIKWVDSTTTYGWVRLEELRDYDLSVYGVGYLIKESKDYVVLTAHISCEGFEAPLAIPRAAILSMEEITPPK